MVVQSFGLPARGEGFEVLIDQRTVVVWIFCQLLRYYLSLKLEHQLVDG